MRRLLPLSILLVGLVLLPGCLTTSGNKNPDTPVITASATEVDAGATVNLSVTCTDPDGDAVTFTWCADGGAFDATSGAAVVWTAPNVTVTDTFTITVTADDGNSGLAQATVQIIVNPGSSSGFAVVVGDSSINNWLPFQGGPADSCRAQHLYYASDVNHTGLINTLSLMPSLMAQGTFNNLEIHICPTTKDTLEATFDNNYTGNTPTLVYSAASQVYGRTGERDYWHDFVLDTKYDYTGGNFIVEFRWAGDDGHSVSSHAFTTAGVYREVSHHKLGNPTGLTHMQAMYMKVTYDE